MAVKTMRNIFNLFNFSAKIGENVLTDNNFVIRKRSISRISFSQYRNKIQPHNLLMNAKKPAITLVFGGVGLYLLPYIRQNETFKSSVLPVVNASSEIPKKPSMRDKYNFIADIVGKSAEAVVCIDIWDNTSYFTEQYTASGSGFIVREDGLILTNAHVVRNTLRGSLQIRLRDGTTYEGQVQDYDMSLDLATIKINAKNLPVMKLGVSSDLRPGEWVVAIGSPLSLTDSVTAGVVSSTNRPGKELGLQNTDIEYIQTDAAITFGNSGGPLVNLDGEVIGINSMKISTGISFAIPIEYAKEFLKRSERKKLLQDKSKQTTPKAKKGYLGLSMVTLTPQIINKLLRSRLIPPHINSGVLVWRVMQGSPADVGGLEPGDVIVKVNDEQIDGVQKMYEIVKPKNEIKLEVFRKGQVLHVKVVPEEANFL